MLMVIFMEIATVSLMLIVDANDNSLETVGRCFLPVSFEMSLDEINS